MEKRVLFTELDDRGSHLRKEITPTAVVTDKRRFPTGLFWDANKTYDVIVADATSASDTLEKAEKNLNNEISRATNAEQALSDRMDDILGIDALDIADLKLIVEDLDPETGILSVIDSKVDKEDFEDLKEDISTIAEVEGFDANGHDYVEIAGIKWATMNVGAQNDTDTGLYFQWGDTYGYESGISIENYKWGPIDWSKAEDWGLTKYNTTDNKTTLDAEDDAATANMGGTWRTPTEEEWLALNAAVNTEWTSDYNNTGIAGLICTDKTDNSKVLFFPAAGLCEDESTPGFNEVGSYWSNSILSDYMGYAISVFIGEYSGGLVISYDGARYYGYTVRGVLGSTTVQQSVLGTTILDSERIAWNNKLDTQEQADWNEADNTKVDYIKNKPDLSLKANTSDLNQLIDNISIEGPADNYVDFGLPSGTLWAKTNIGATSPEETGLYFLWGDTEGYTANQVGTDKVFNWDDYKWTEDGGSTFTKYTYDGTAQLELIDDAANVALGGDWCIPSNTQLEELINNTSNTWISDYNGTGISGRLFYETGKNPSDSSTITMFLPATGSATNSSVNNVGTNGYYWTSTLTITDSQSQISKNLLIYDWDIMGGSSSRYYGSCIRPVTSTIPTGEKILGKTATDAEKAAWNAKSNFSGSYTDLTNKPTIPSIWTGTQAQYDLIDPIDPSTIYIIQ